ncbi:Mobile element protein [Klebsiella pneumoniae subsp. pneumoniae ST258-K26BO]|nr:Mobile element protein [Klebsiella pneumoniae subsp. pneumoniae ST258-K26BO]
MAYDFKEAFFCIYDEPDKQSAQNAFEAWKNSLPPYGMEPFKKLVKTVHNHYDDIFAYWDAPFSLTNGYTEGLNGLIKMSNRLGRGYSYEIIRAKTLYSKEARKVGSGIRAGRGKVEDGPHIPTLLKQADVQRRCTPKKPARLAVVFEQDEARSSMDRTFRHC